MAMSSEWIMQPMSLLHISHALPNNAQCVRTVKTVCRG
jgi:hypothetical protein